MRTVKQRKKHREYMRIWLKTHPQKPLSKEQKLRHYITTKTWMGIRKKRLKDKYGLGVGTVMRYGFRLALKIYEKYNRECIYCKNKDDLTLHHLDNHGRNYQEKGLKPNNNEKNLILICRKCHGRIHGLEGGGRPKKFHL